MKSIVFTLLPMLMLSGCAFTNIEQGLAGMVGKPVDQAVAKLGQPNAERQLGELRVVEWRNWSYGPSVDGAGTGLPALPMAALDNASDPPRRYSAVPRFQTRFEMCNVTMVVDSNNIIRRYDYTGNFEGCYTVGQALKDKA